MFVLVCYYAFVLILVLANGVYFLWTSGTLGAYGFAPVQQSEPHRVAQQIKPDALKLLTPAEVSRVEAMVQADLAPKECVQAGPFEDVQVQALRRILEPAWPAGAWVFESVQVPPRWMATPISGAQETARIFLQARVVSDSSMESVTTSSLSTELATRSGAAPDSTPWVT